MNKSVISFVVLILTIGNISGQPRLWNLDKLSKASVENPSLVEQIIKNADKLLPKTIFLLRSFGLPCCGIFTLVAIFLAKVFTLFSLPLYVKTLPAGKRESNFEYGFHNKAPLG